MAVGDGVPDAVGLSLPGQLAHQLQRKGNGTAQTVAGGDIAVHDDLGIQHLGECEALLGVDLLRRAKVEVTIASATGNRAITSSHKVHITADALAEDIDYSDVDMVVLPGGIPGTPNLAANKTVTDTCIAFAKAGKKVAAICAAPIVLERAGLTGGKRVTG
mgnify:CR=1 FL=1